MKKDKKQSLRPNELGARTFTGIVVSLKMKGPAVVKVERKIIHPMYKKVLKRSSRFKVDTNSLELSLDDKVRIVETKPFSKGKYFKIERKLNGSA